jgi:hypothetical protein
MSNHNEKKLFKFYFGKMHKLCHVAKINLAMWINIKPSIMDDGDFF